MIEIDSGISDTIRDIENMSDEEIMALMLQAKNENAIANYQLAMIWKLKKGIFSLNESIKKFNKASKLSSWAMIILTVIIAILTAVLVFSK